MTGLTSRVHSKAREEGGLGGVACEKEATLGRLWRSRKREGGGAGWAKKAEWAGWLLGRLGQKLKKILSE
jgi:hypothetical protein